MARRSKTKLQFEILVGKVTGIASKLDGGTVLISWRRGSGNKGTTKRVLVEKNVASWNEKIVFTSTLFKDETTNLYEEKYLSLTLKEVNI